MSSRRRRDLWDDASGRRQVRHSTHATEEDGNGTDRGHRVRLARRRHRGAGRGRGLRARRLDASSSTAGEEGDRFKLDETMDSEALLLGRVTYEGFAAAWPRGRASSPTSSTHAQVRRLLDARASRSGTTRPCSTATWSRRSSKLKQDAGRRHRRPRQRQLAQTLLEHDLVDELRLMVFPVVLGTGKRLFGETTDKKRLAARGLEDGRRRRRDPDLRASRLDPHAPERA